MQKQIEIEYKILLTKDIFQHILSDYQPFIEKDYIQINDYFTHPLLQERKYMLRIRSKDQSYEMTLKIPHHQHRLEYNINLSQAEKDCFYQGHDIHNEITYILKQNGICISDLKQQFSLTTHRYDIILPEGVLSLDENHYCHCHDYELEFEVHEEKSGYQKFLDIIKPYHLHYTKNCDSKIKRVLDHL